MGIDDLNAVRNHFGESGQNQIGDIDSDGAVGLSDLNFVRNHFLPWECPPNADCSAAIYVPFRIQIGDLSSQFSLLTVPYARASDVSSDGGVIVGSNAGAASNLAYRWTASTGIETLGDLPGGNEASSANGVSADGDTIVGFSRSANGGEAFRWTPSGGMVGLGDLAGGEVFSNAMAVSADGSVVVGYGSRERVDRNEAFRWNAESGMQGLGYVKEDKPFSGAFGISDDGRVIVGLSGLAPDSRAFRWTESEGMAALRTSSGLEFRSHANDASGDGSIIVGAAYFDSDEAHAMIWDAEHGMRDLQELLAVELGLADQLAGWQLNSATSVSADGLVIVGNGHDPAGSERGWMVHLDAGVFATSSNMPEPSASMLLGIALPCIFFASRFRLRSESAGI